MIMAKGKKDVNSGIFFRLYKHKEKKKPNPLNMRNDDDDDDFGWCKSIKRKRQNFKKKKKPKQIRISFLQCFISQQKKNTQTQRLLWTNAVDSGISVQSNIDSIVLLLLLSFLFSFSSKKNKMSVRNHKKNTQ